MLGAIFTALLAAMPLTSAAPLASNDTPMALQPWQVSIVNTHSPSGRAGNAPYSFLYTSIADPNTILAGTTINRPASFLPTEVNCTLRWNSYFAESPFGWVTPCADVNYNTARWTVQMLEQNLTGYGPTATRDFRLRFVLEQSMLLSTGVITKTFTGEGAFAVGLNMGIVCGGSGVCNHFLKDESQPVLIQQQLTSTKCTGGTCD